MSGSSLVNCEDRTLDRIEASRRLLPLPVRPVLGHWLLLSRPLLRSALLLPPLLVLLWLMSDPHGLSHRPFPEVRSRLSGGPFH